MKLHFVGTGGAREVTSTQQRKTAGMILESDEASLYIDPGPGSIVHCQDYDTEKVKGLIVTHAHLDHYSDAEPIIEMISFRHENFCKLMGPETVLKGYSDLDQSVSNYHQELCTDVVNLTETEETEFEGLKVESQEMFHNEPKCRGLKISDGEKKIGFWTDTAFSEELIEFYSDCDTIVINCPVPKEESSRKHTSVSEVPDILNGLEASTAILTHFSIRMLNSDMNEQKTWLDEKVDQKVVFAHDGMTFPGDRKLSSF